MNTIQMHLSQKEKIFSRFFSAFFESALNSEHFQKKMIPLLVGTFKLMYLNSNIFKKRWITDHEKRA